MAITDNLVIRVKPQAGDTAIKDVVSGSLFSGSAATLVDRSGNGTDYAWQISNGDMTLIPSSPRSVAPTTAGGGITMAVTLKVLNAPNTDLTRYAGFVDSTLGNGLRLFKDGSDMVDSRYGDGSSTVTDALGAGGTTELTYVVRVKGGSPLTLDTWVTTAGRSGTASNATSTGTFAGAYSLTTALLRGGASDVIQIKDYCVWYRECTDIECASLADSLRTTLDGAGSSNGTASGATMVGAASLSPGGATGNGSATTSGAALTGTASIAPGAASGTSPGGTLTTKPFQNNTTTVLANQTGVTLNIWNANTGALVLQKTGLSTDANGVITVQDPAIVTGTTYAYEPVFSTGARRLPTKAAT